MVSVACNSRPPENLIVTANPQIQLNTILAASNLKHVFESGYSTANEDTGLVSNVVDRIVDTRGWQIDVTDSDAGGASFEIIDVEFFD